MVWRIMVTMMMPTWSSNERRDGGQKKKRHYQGDQQESSVLVCLLHCVMGFLPGMLPLLAKGHLAVLGAESPTATLATCKSGLTLLYRATVNGMVRVGGREVWS